MGVSAVNTMWVLLGLAMVFLMQAGFAGELTDGALAGRRNHRRL